MSLCYCSCYFLSPVPTNHLENCVGGDFENDLDNDPCEPAVSRVPGNMIVLCSRREIQSSIASCISTLEYLAIKPSTTVWNSSSFSSLDSIDFSVGTVDTFEEVKRQKRGGGFEEGKKGKRK